MKPKRIPTIFFIFFLAVLNQAAVAQTAQGKPLYLFCVNPMGYVDAAGQVVIPARFDFERDFSEGRAVVFLDEKYGLIDEQGNYILEPKYDFVGDLRGGLAPVNLNGKWGFADGKGTIVIPFQYDQARGFSENLAAVKTNGKWGFMDPAGQWVIVPQFDDAFNFSEGLANVNCGTYINRQGKTVFTLKTLPRDLDPVCHVQFKDGMVLAYSSGHGSPVIEYESYVDKTGRDFYDWQGESEDEKDKVYGGDHFYHQGYLSRFNEGAAVTCVKEKLGFIDLKGKIIIPPQYDEAGPFSEGLAMVSLAGKAGYIDQKGNQVIPLQFAFTGKPFVNGLAPVLLEVDDDNPERGWRYIDRTGNFAFPGRFKTAEPFSQGFALVSQMTENTYYYFFIDKTGARQFGMNFINAKSFENGLAFVETTAGQGYINLQGKFILGPYSYVGDNSGKLTRYQKVAWGYLNGEGQTVIAPQFTRAKDFVNGMAVVQSEGKTKIIDSTGSVVSTLADIDFDDTGAGVGDQLLGYSCPITVRSDSDGHIYLQPQWGYMDLNGKVVIPAQYDACEPFSEGLALVYEERGYNGFIDEKGNVIIPFDESEKSSFSGGVAKVCDLPDGPLSTYRYINKSNQPVKAPPPAPATSPGLTGTQGTDGYFRWSNSRGELKAKYYRPTLKLYPEDVTSIFDDNLPKDAVDKDW